MSLTLYVLSNSPEDAPENDIQEDLETKLDRLIAEELHVSISDITSEFIQEYRRNHIYPDMQVDFTNRYGGLNPRYEAYYTESEIAQLRNKAQIFFQSLGE